MAIPVLVGGLASFVVAEIVAHLLDAWNGDPEADVDAVLQQAQKQAVLRGGLDYNRPAMVEESVAKAFQGIRPERTLSQLALLRSGQMDITNDDKPVLTYIAAQLGIDPMDLIKRSSPARMGDYSDLTKAIPPQLRDGLGGTNG